MANLLKYIQCASSDTRPPMLDRTDFASWQQQIRLYCRERNEGPLHLGPERPRVYSDLSPEDKERYNADIRATNILLQGLPKDIYSLINHYTDAKDIWDNVKMLLEGSELTKEDYESQLYDDFEHLCQYKGETIHDYYVWFAKLINDMRNIKMTMSKMQLNSKFVNNITSSNPRNQATIQDGRVIVQNVQGRQNRGQGNNAWGAGAAGYGGAQNRVGNANPGQARQVRCYNCNSISHIARNYTQPKRPQNSEYFKDKILLMQAQENKDLALNVDKVFQADDCDAFDSDVDEAPTAQTMFMANLSSADLVYDEVGPSYDSDILSEVHDHDHYQDVVCEHHEEHEMHDDVQPNYVVDSHANYTSDSNMIPYDQYVKDNAVPVVQSNVSSVPNDAYMMIFNDMHEPHAQSVSDTTRNTIVDNSLTAELATYKEQVELYERRARFELTETEQKINEQLRIVITDRNIKEENLKKELHSVKMQLASTINHNNSMVEDVTSLKKDFKQKENKYLEEFLDMKALKEKVEDKLYKQDQSLQTPALYNGYEIIKNNHVPALVHNTEDTLEIAEITKMKMNDKMKDPECVTHKVKIAPPDFSKENYLATFTPQKQLTLEQIFWSQDLIKMKEEALKKQTIASRPIKALAVYPLNTPATLVPRVLPTKSQVKINIFALIQLFRNLRKPVKRELHQQGSLKGKGVLNKPRNVISPRHAIDVEPIPLHNRNNRELHLYYLKHLKESVETLRKIVEEAKVERPLDSVSLNLLSQTRKLSHSTMELRSLIS
ncbi:hypothetical protein Tco_0961239 [Tanacetum coccineum]